jgi:hypothetical protein
MSNATWGDLIRADSTSWMPFSYRMVDCPCPEDKNISWFVSVIFLVRNKNLTKSDELTEILGPSKEYTTPHLCTAPR